MCPYTPKGMYYLPRIEQTTITVTNQEHSLICKKLLEKKKNIYIKYSQAIIHNYSCFPNGQIFKLLIQEFKFYSFNHSKEIPNKTLPNTSICESHFDSTFISDVTENI